MVQSSRRIAEPLPLYLTSLAALAMLILGQAPTAWAQNTAYGTNALAGGGNSAFGDDALRFNSAGNDNTAIGNAALEDNTGSSSTGSANTATGVGALANNLLGNGNTATGLNASYFNTTGGFNTAIGYAALQDDSDGSNNVAIGEEAGFYLTSGSNNIEIGNPGATSDAETIRIGTPGTQKAVFIAGVFGASITGGCGVVVASTGQIGCVKSSARYKRDIRDMGDASDKLMKLRPVTFLYKADETGAKQYGLIAEEVAKVYPELVIHGPDGKVETVAYQMLPAMLLNEVQKQAGANQGFVHQLAQKDAQIATLQLQICAIQKKNVEIDAMAARLDALERQACASRPDLLASATR
jgi:hypothetical protein